jgi:hypothetical protein
MPHVASFITLVHDAEQRLAESFELVGHAHAAEWEIAHGAHTLATLSFEHVSRLEPIRARYEAKRNEHAQHEPNRFFAEPIVEARVGPIGLIRDLQDLMSLTGFVESAWTIVDQGAKSLKDTELKTACEAALADTPLQTRWLKTHIKVVSPQALLLAH